VRWSPLALALGVFLVWSARDGGYRSTEWLPGTLFVLGLTVVVALTEGRPFTRRPTLAVASILFAAFTTWSFLSIAWADVKGDAWDGANRTLLYLCVFLLFAWRPIPARVGAALLGAFVLVTAAIGSVDFLRAVTADRSEGFFIAGRLSSPVTYPNANAALFLAPFVPAVWLASRREVPSVVRGVMLACAGVLLELATMCQSRASLVALPLTIVVVLAVAPDRLRLLVPLAAVAIPAALGASRLLDVYSAVVDGHDVRSSLTEARSVVAWSAVALFLTGVLFALVDRRVRVPARATRTLSWLVVVAAVVAVAVAVPVLIGRYGDPVDRAAAAWRDFKTNKSDTTTTHLVSGFGSPRYDLWRVALDEFKRAPITGVGVDNFAVDYLRLRRTNQEPAHQHSLELRVLAQTGLVGALLFAGFLVAVILSATPSLRQRDTFAAGLAAACVGAFAYWLIHGSVDWFWEVPALGAPAMAWLAVATQAVPNELPRQNRRLPLYAGAPLVLVAGVAAVALASSWIAAKEVDAAAAGWASDPAKAFDRLDLARRLNPFSDRADLVAGVIASRIRDSRRERIAFARVLERNPHNWYARFELAVLDARQGRTRAALRQLRLVSRMNPREPLTKEIQQTIISGHRVSQAEVDRAFRQRTELLTGARQR
jgi:hypothetical protein